MTPLARLYFGQLAEPVRQRVPDPWHALQLYDDLHCFEVSAIRPAVSDSLEGGTFGTTLHALPGPFFLPSPATWIEFEWGGHRLAWLCVEPTPDEWIVLVVNETLTARPAVQATLPNLLSPRWKVGHIVPNRALADLFPNIEFSPDEALSLFTEIVFVLDVINTPTLVSLVEHEPHRGFARRLRNSVHGSYPLRAWHEVLINPGAVQRVTDSSGRLCGRKCLHFVRKHRRSLADGRETLVSAHWRGDPAIGMMRTRYKVEPMKKLLRGLR